MSPKLRTPLPYVGTKSMLTSKLIPLIPAHHHYVEVCGGSLALLLAKPPSAAETANDLDGQLVTFWRVLRDQPDELISAIELTPHSRYEYYDALKNEGKSDLEIARKVWVRLTQGTNRSLVNPQRPMWAKRLTTGSHPDILARKVNQLVAVTTRLQHVSLEQRPAVEMVKMYGPAANALLYIDPPYLNSPNRYRDEMTAEDHEELLDAASNAKASVMISGYSTPLYEEKLKDWDRHEFSGRARVTVGKLVDRTEVVWVKC